MQCQEDKNSVSVLRLWLSWEHLTTDIISKDNRLLSSVFWHLVAMTTPLRYQLPWWFHPLGCGDLTVSCGRHWKGLTNHLTPCCRWPGWGCRGGPGQRSTYQQQWQQVYLHHQEELKPGSTLQLSEPAAASYQQLLSEGRSGPDCGSG